jgi:DNA-binding response OmpR family regulator
MKHLNILVVEDDVLLGLTLGDMLEDMGHHVCAVTATVSGAVADAQKYKPELLIVDAWLKDGSGLSVVEKICKNGHVPHLYASWDISKILLTEPDAVAIQKPYQLAELEAAIERAMVAKAPIAGKNKKSILA